MSNIGAEHFDALRKVKAWLDNKSGFRTVDWSRVRSFTYDVDGLARVNTCIGICSRNIEIMDKQIALMPPCLTRKTLTSVRQSWAIKRGELVTLGGNIDYHVQQLASMVGVNNAQ